MSIPLYNILNFKAAHILNLIDFKNKNSNFSTINSKKISKTFQDENKENLHTNPQDDFVQKPVKKVSNSENKSSVLLRDNIPSIESKINQYLKESQNNYLNPQDSSKTNEDIKKREEEKKQRTSSIDIILKVKSDKSSSSSFSDTEETYTPNKYPRYSKKMKRNFSFKDTFKAHSRLFTTEKINRRAYRSHDSRHLNSRGLLRNSYQINPFNQNGNIY